MRRSAAPFTCFVLAAGLLAAATGCATTRPTNEAIAAAKTAVEDAESSGAPGYASGELAQAMEKLENAQEARGENEYTEARRLGEQAEVDARVAEAKAEAIRARTIEPLR